MNNISTYIIEKLHLNKHVSADLYNVGDKCIMMSYYNFKNGNEPFISLDIMKIIKIDGNKLYYEFKTPFAHAMNLDKPAECDINKKNADYWYYCLLDTICEMIIPHIEALDVIDEIENNNNKYKFFKKLGYIPDNIKVDENKEFEIMKNVDDFKIVSYTKKDIDKLKKALI